MGFIAPICERGQEFDVLRMDLQFWALASWFGLSSDYVLDVGLLLEAGASEVRRFKIAVPFATHQGSVEGDLREKVGRKAAVVIGPGTRLGTDGERITFSTPSRRECAFTKVGTVDEWPVYREPGVTVCVFTLNDPVPAGKAAYVRVRFPVDRPFRSVTRKRSGLGQNGALIDLRVADTHEVDDDTEFAQYRDLIAKIHWLRVVVIIRAALQLRAVSPSPSSLRLLERGIWESYIGRSLAARRSGAIAALIAYEFDVESDDGGKPRPVGRHAPFNVFIDVSREFGLLPIGNFVRMLFLVVVGAMIGRNVFLSDLGVFGTFLRNLADFVGDRGLVILTALGALGAVSFLPPVRRAVQKARRWFGHFGRG